MPAAFYLPGFFMEVQGFFMKDRHLDETNQIAPFVTSSVGRLTGVMIKS